MLQDYENNPEYGSNHQNFSYTPGDPGTPGTQGAPGIPGENSQAELNEYENYTEYAQNGSYANQNFDSQTNDTYTPPSFSPRTARSRTAGSSNAAKLNASSNAAKNIASPVTLAQAYAQVSAKSQPQYQSQSQNYEQNYAQNYAQQQYNQPAFQENQPRILEGTVHNTPHPLNSGNILPRSPRTTRKRKIIRALSIIFVLLLVILTGCGFYAWHWVDSRMQRDKWLTDMPDTQGTTWLILGSDQREGEEAKYITGFRTDTILVLTKPSSGHSSLISIPRDSLVTINNKRMKINAVAQLLGKPALTSAVETITGHHINHVAEVRFNGLTKVVDALGGIDLCYNRTVNDARSGMNWVAGCHHSDGNAALAFSRMRYSDPQSDFGRAARQRMVISAIIKKALSKETLTNLGKVKSVAEAGLSSIVFDEKSNPATLWQMSQAFKDATGSNGITGTVYWTNPDYRVPGVGSSVLLDDAKNLDLFNQLASGEHAPGVVGTLAELQNK